MIQTMRLNATESVLEEQAKAKENFILCHLPGFAEFAERVPREKRATTESAKKWFGGMSFEESVKAVRRGDVSGVAASDRLLAEMEGLAPVSHSWRTIDSVVGMCPNVPQYLSGNPYSMRLKRRYATATSPRSDW
jgi:hypothetical protein